MNTAGKTPVVISDEPIREVESFIYLAMAVWWKEEGDTDRDIKWWIGIAKDCINHAGLLEYPHYCQTTDTQLQYEVSRIGRSKDTVIDKIKLCRGLKYCTTPISQTYLQHPMAWKDHE